MTALYVALTIWGGVFSMSFHSHTTGGGKVPLPLRMVVTLALTIGVCGLVARWVS